jgi:hypothetical protein
MDIKSNMKPFYIYTENDTLYIRNINEETSKIADDIKFYSVAIDDKEDIHICCVNSDGNLLHIYNIKNSWRRKLLFKYRNPLENIKDLKLHLIEDYLNVFLLEGSSLSSNLYHVTHINKNVNRRKLSINEINNVIYENNSFYKIDIDEDNNIRFEYNCLENRGGRRRLKLFSNKTKTWSNKEILEEEKIEEENGQKNQVLNKEENVEKEYPIPKEYLDTPIIEQRRNSKNKRNNQNNVVAEVKEEPTIKDDIMMYCHTIKYNK